MGSRQKEESKRTISIHLRSVERRHTHHSTRWHTVSQLNSYTSAGPGELMLTNEGSISLTHTRVAPVGPCAFISPCCSCMRDQQETLTFTKGEWTLEVHTFNPRVRILDVSLPYAQQAYVKELNGNDTLSGLEGRVVGPRSADNRLQNAFLPNNTGRRV